jgi:hypothetical protein
VESSLAPQIGLLHRVENGDMMSTHESDIVDLKSGDFERSNCIACHALTVGDLLGRSGRSDVIGFSTGHEPLPSDATVAGPAEFIVLADGGENRCESADECRIAMPTSKRDQCEARGKKREWLCFAA